MLLNKKIPAKYILNKVKYDALIVFIISISVFLFTNKYKHLVPEIPIAIPAFLGTAISVILSFKLNQSYDRWWEARKIWGSIVNDSRTLVLQLQSFAKDGDDDIKKIAWRQIAWCFSLGQSLRGLDINESVEKHLSSEEILHIKTHKNKPLAILQLNTLHIRKLKDDGKLDIFSQIQINNTFVNFSNAQGMAERIKNTVFPVTYRLFLHFIIYLFVITLSISLVNIEGFFEIPLLILLSSAFFLLEKTATHLQDPFSNLPTDTPMTSIASNIEVNIKQLMNESLIPEKDISNQFYLL